MLSIPTYAMNCFLLPITLCQDIEKAAARFFWGSTIENRKCHWAKWDVLTSPKANGGIGFKELHYFNLAMLAKQLWGLIQNQNSVTFKIFNAKYFKRTDIWHAGVGYRPSYIWRSLLAARELITEGEAWRVGDGRSIRIGCDRWIGMKEVRKATNIQHDTRSECVEVLIDQQTKTWREDLILNLFDQRDAQDILAMPLTSNPPSDRRYWKFTKTGMFSVKSAYHAAIAKFGGLSVNRAAPSLFPKGWKKIWRMSAIPRVRMFIWRSCFNALPTRDNLYRRGGIEDPICGLCGEKPETVDHLLMQCSTVTPVWYTSMLRLNIPRIGQTSFKELLWTCLETHPPEFTSLMAYLAWEIWQQRNAMIFENCPFIFTDVIRRAQSRWGEFQTTQQPAATMRRKAESEERWEPPAEGRTKLNCDIAVGVDGKVGFGFVLRDHQGNVMLAGKVVKTAAGTTTVLEGLAIRHALQMCRQYHFLANIVESDNKAIVEAINGLKTPELYADVIVSEIVELKTSVAWSDVRHVHRSANGVAHVIAHGQEFISIRHTPEHVAHLVLNDVMVF